MMRSSILIRDMRKSKDNSTGKVRTDGSVGGETECYSSDTDSYSNSHSADSGVANWEEFVLKDGSLFYIEYLPQEVTKINVAAGGKVEFPRTSLRSGKKSCRRPPSSRTEDFNTTSNNLFSNVDTSEESAKNLELVITATDRYRFGRRSTAVESILGFHVLPFVDQPECLMVEGFVHDMPALFQQGKQIPIGRGDWFKSLDHIEIRTSNIDELLLQFVEPTKVSLKFQSPSLLQKPDECVKEGVTNTVRKIENYAHFSNIFDRLLTLPRNSMEFGFLILPPECYQNDEHKSSLYHFPEDPDNFLYKARGSFLTLNAVLSEELKTKPFASTITFESVEYFVFYRKIKSFLVLFSYPSKMVTLSEGNLRADELLTYIGFMQPTMNLDSFKIPTFREFMKNFCNTQRIRFLLQKGQNRIQLSLEDCLNETQHLPLPKEAQLRIFDALSEMEAMDYRSWNDEPLHTHREFFFYGSTLYYDNLMLASQMPVDLRRYIDVYLRCRGIFDFISTHNTKEFYIWEEIKLNEYKDRYFLAICGRGHLILAVILKLFCTSDLEVDGKIHPSLFYIEEIQETIDHLIQCGIESLAMFWQVSNKRPEIQDLNYLDDDTADSAKENKKIEYCANRQKIAPISVAAGVKDAEINMQRSTSYDEETHICSSLGGSSVQSLTPSEDDSSKKRPIANVDESDDSGSDWEHFAEDTILRYGNDTEQQLHVTENLWKEISNVVPIKISSGWNNNIIYYIYVDRHNNTSFRPIKSNEHVTPFAREMHLVFHQIRKVLQGTKHFKRDCQRKTNLRDLIPVKEHSMTIEVKLKNSNKYTFVVVGRLFLTPSKEVYICHRSNISANMVEMASRLSLFTTG